MAGLVDPATGSLRIDKLEKELSGSIFADKRHQRVDAMKKKVVTTVANYDEFKNFVSCAEDMLEPVSSAELAELRQAKSGWQRKSSKAQASARQRSSKKKTGEPMADPCTRPPQSTLDFERDWRRCNDAAHRCRYLETHGVQVLAPIWATELDATTLCTIIDVLLHTDDLPFTDWLQAIVNADRFQLSVLFLDAAERRAVCDKLPRNHPLKMHF